MDTSDKTILLLDTLAGLPGPLSDAFNEMTIDMCQQALTIDTLTAEVSRLKVDRHRVKALYAICCRIRRTLLVGLRASKSREGRLWAVADILHDILPYDNPEPLKQAIKARDLDALEAAIGGDHE